MVFLDSLGWPVERIKGRPVLNALRLLIHTRKIVRTWKPPRPSNRYESQEDNGNG